MPWKKYYMDLELAPEGTGDRKTNCKLNHISFEQAIEIFNCSFAMYYSIVIIIPQIIGPIKF